MKTLMLAAWALAASGWGCGATVGDPCTTNADCSNQLCINTVTAPGGYCSRLCTPEEEEACPGGSTCVRDGAGRGLSACFRECDQMGDCRSGYACSVLPGSRRAVCTGVSG
ncbi:MAG TPA: hypothetical protein VEY30_12405 [Myxococcaceae bacterium]|nr:hypothetical protein [Myxococcaceae bacterium]